MVITGSFPPQKCGVGDYTFSLTQELSGISDIKVGILTSAGQDPVSVSDGAEIFPIIKKWSFFEITKLIKFIRHWSPDIVHIQYPTQGYRQRLLSDLLPLICYLMGSKIVQTWHEGYGWLRTPQFLMKALIPSTLIVVRPQYREYLPPFMRWFLGRRKLQYIPNASSVPKASLSYDERIELRKQSLQGQKRLIVFFGFVYPKKGVTLIFDIADPNSDHIVIAGQIDQAGAYRDEVLRRCTSEPWLGKVTITGFISVESASRLLSVADAVILPFRTGGGEWNTSIHSAALQGTFVLTTSQLKNGYDPLHNIYYSKIDDVLSMKGALNIYAGVKINNRIKIDDEWKKMAAEHYVIYKSILTRNFSK